MDNPYRITEEEIRQIEECITSSRPLPGAVGKKVVTTLRTLYVGNEMTERLAEKFLNFGTAIGALPADSQVAKVFNTEILPTFATLAPKAYDEAAQKVVAITRNRPHAFANQPGWGKDYATEARLTDL